MKEELIMKKMLVAVFVISCLALSVAGTAQAAGTSFSGSTYLSYGTFASIVVATSSNVFMLYNGASTAQTYGAFTKNKAGDKYYATGGGQGTQPGLYYQQSDAFVSDVAFTGMESDDEFAAGSGWTAQ